MYAAIVGLSASALPSPLGNSDAVELETSGYRLRNIRGHLQKLEDAATRCSGIEMVRTPRAAAAAGPHTQRVLLQAA